jgi:RNA polymerase sigma-70 factor (ECF subfamily)
MAPGTEDFERWMDEARAGSKEALGEMLEMCRRYLLSIAQGELAPDLQAKGSPSDLVQETFLEAQRDFVQFGGTSEQELLRWLRQILLHNVGTFSRLFRETSKRDLTREITAGAGPFENTLWNIVPDDGSSPSRVAMQHEQAVALQRALARLPDDYRQVIMLRYEQQHAFEEIGRRMNRSPEAVRKLWARAMERLRQEWEGSS